MDPVPAGIAFVLGPLLLAGGGLLAWVAVRGWRGDLARNPWVGIRTRSTLAGDEAWRIGHRAAGPWLIMASLGSIIPGAVILFRPDNDTAVLLIMAGMGVMVALVAVGAAIATSAAKQVDP